MEPRKSLAAFALSNALIMPDSLAMDAMGPDLKKSDLTSDNPGSAKPGARRLFDFLPRLLSSIALMGFALAAWWFGGKIFIIIWLAATIAVFWEWQRLIEGAQKRARFLTGCLFLVLIAFFTSRSNFAAAGVSLGLGACLLASLAGPGRRIWASSGVLYAGCLIGSLSILADDAAYGPRAILWLFAIVWGTDVFAYLAGRLLGGPKLWKRISPSKTWSGTLIGITCGAALGSFVGTKGLTVPVFAAPIFALSLATAAVAQAGDIFESWMKRHFGVKDSSHLIPGHGGFMDRLDGFIAAAIFAVVIGLIRYSGTYAEGLFNWS